MGTVSRTEIKAGTIKRAALHMVVIYVLKENTSYFLLWYQIQKFRGQKFYPDFIYFISIISGKKKYLKDSTMLYVRTKQRAAHGITFLGI